MSLLRLGAARRALVVFPGARRFVSGGGSGDEVRDKLSTLDTDSVLDTIKDAVSTWDGNDYVFCVWASSYTAFLCVGFWAQFSSEKYRLRQEIAWLTSELEKQRNLANAKQKRKQK
jgi:hypothetical protein